MMIKIYDSLLCAIIVLAWIFYKFEKKESISWQIPLAFALIGTVQMISCIVAMLIFGKRIPNGVIEIFQGFSWYLSGMFGIGIAFALAGIILGLIRLRANRVRAPYSSEQRSPREVSGD